MGGSRWWSFLWQRLLKGRPFRCLRCSLGGQVSGQSQTLQESSGPGECMASFLHPIQICVMGLMLCVDELCLKHKHVLIKNITIYLSMCHRCLMLSEWPNLCPSPCSPTVPLRKQRQSFSRSSTRTLICGQESLSGKHFGLHRFFKK